MSEDEARKHLEREYPKETREVIDELRFRGLDATGCRVLPSDTTHDLAPLFLGESTHWSSANHDLEAGIRFTLRDDAVVGIDQLPD